MPKKTKKSKVKKQYSLEFGNLEYDDKCKEFRAVKLAGEIIYKLDQTRYMGHLRDQTKDVCEAISAKLGIEFTKQDLDKARKTGYVEA